MSTPEPVDALYQRYAPQAYRRARHLLGNEAEAHEVVHDLFVSLLERPEQFEGRSQWSTFMYSAVTHACLNRLRNQRNRLRLLREVTPTLDAASQRAESPEALSALRWMLERMPPELATVAVHHHMDGMTHAEIAQVLDCSPRHVGDLVERLTAWCARKGVTR